MKAIFYREWRSYFYSPIGYIFTAVFMALCSFFFVNGALMYQKADLSVVFSNINIIYLFLISLITMGLFSTERGRKTDQLLLTSPVSVTRIVIGKYLAAMGVFGVTLMLSLVYPIILNLFGSPSQSEMFGIYIGFILLWGAFIAVGTFISSLTENQVIAAVVTFGVLMIVYYLGTLSANITNKTLQAIVGWFSLIDRYNEFAGGILNISSIIYYLSFVFVFLFLTVQVIVRRQYSDTKIRINNMVVTAATIVAVILVNAIISAIAAKLPLEVDLTHDSVYEYSEQTKEVLGELKDEVNLYALYPDGANGEYVDTVRRYLEDYESMSDKIKVEYRDPYEEPAFARRYGDNIEIGSVIVTVGDRHRVIPYSQIYNVNQYTGSTYINAEKLITSAIRYVSGAGQDIHAYFVKGHNEYTSKTSQLTSELTNEGYTVGDISLTAEGIPEDAGLLISLAPSADFTAEEIDVLDSYLQNGGKIAFAFAAGTSPMERLYSYLGEWGITVNNDLVIETDTSRSFRSQSGVPVPAPIIQEHSITEKLIESDVPTVAPASCSFKLSDTNPQYTLVTPLLKTTEDSWGMKDMTASSLEKKAVDIDGPLTVAALSEKQTGEQSGRIFVIGSIQAIELQGILNDSSYSNGDFILNSLSYLSGKGDAMNIRSKMVSAESLTMTEQQVKVSGIIVQYVIPILIMVLGIVVWLRRRYL